MKIEWGDKHSLTVYLSTLKHGDCFLFYNSDDQSPCIKTDEDTYVFLSNGGQYDVGDEDLLVIRLNARVVLTNAPMRYTSAFTSQPTEPTGGETYTHDICST